jgi:proteic killer suppression protein
MIATFSDKLLESLYCDGRSKGIPSDLRSVVCRKLDMLNAAVYLNDLRVPPGNRLERLSGDRSGQHSIRVNRQWRITFIWRDGAAHGVALEDYH